MTTHYKRDPSGTPQEVNSFMYKKLYGDKDNSHALGHTEGSQLGALGSSHSPGGSGDTNRQTPILNAPDLLEAVKMAYRKHHLGDDSIGWGELADTLLNVLCEAMGDNEFVAWVEEVTP